MSTLQCDRCPKRLKHSEIHLCKKCSCGFCDDCNPGHECVRGARQLELRAKQVYPDDAPPITVPRPKVETAGPVDWEVKYHALFIEHNEAMRSIAKLEGDIGEFVYCEKHDWTEEDNPGMRKGD